MKKRSTRRYTLEELDKQLAKVVRPPKPHHPTPWEFDGACIISTLEDGSKVVVAHVYQDSDKDFLLEAVNRYDELRAKAK